MFFVGLGGAGQRHLRILRSRLPRARFTAHRRILATPPLNADFSVAAASLETAFGLEMRASIEDGLADRPDLVVIATPSSLHYEPMMQAAKAGCGILVEKPWSHTPAGFGAFRNALAASDAPFWISFQRRYHPLLKRTRDLVRSGVLGRIVSARFAVGSYVPAWHPYEDWRGLYAVRPDLGGGVLLTEIHEVDLCHWFFGAPSAVGCVGGNFGPEPLDVEDTVHMSLLYDGFAAAISLCFMQRKNERHLSVAGTAGHVAWNAEGNRLLHIDYDSGRTEELAEAHYANDAMFEAQADALLSAGQGDPEEHLRAAWVSQVVVAAARVSMAERRIVALPLYPDESIR